MPGLRRVEGALHMPGRRRVEGAWRMHGLRRVEGAWRLPGRRRGEGAWRMPGLRRQDINEMSCAARLRSPACAELGAARAVAAAVAVVVLRHAIAEDGVRGQGRLAGGKKVSAHGVEQLGEAVKPAKARCNRTS